MLLDVRPLLRTPGKRLDFQFEMDLTDVEFAGRYPVSRPVLVEGEVRHTADILSLDMTIRSTLDAVCDLCGKEFLLDKEVPYSCVLTEELQNEDNLDIVLLEGGKVDVVNWPAPSSFSKWTFKHCVRKIAKVCVPGVVPI